LTGAIHTSSANRVAILQSPPALTMAVLQPGDELPAPSPWRVTLQIEPKRATQCGIMLQTQSRHETPI